MKTTRRQRTPEQKPRRPNAASGSRHWPRSVAVMSEDERTALVMRVGAIVTFEGHALSAFNSCLILTQLPTASMVGGFHQWKTKGRKVKKGEHGLMIWVPTGRKDKDEDAAPAPEASEDKDKRAGFIMGTVFDVTQTEPALDRPELYRRAADVCAARGQ